MEENEKKPEIRLKDIRQEREILLKKTPVDVTKVLKKFGLYCLLGIVFLMGMYLIFAPSSDGDQSDKVGLNDVPQATDTGMQSDKRKAYEEEMMRQREQEKKKIRESLSDYWKSDSIRKLEYGKSEDFQTLDSGDDFEQPAKNPAVRGYRNIQNTLGSFYKDTSETDNLRKEIEQLKEQLAEKEIPQDPVETQLTLMEKSYEMAAKYFPGNTSKNTDSLMPNPDDESFVAFLPTRKNVVSNLFRKQSNAEFLRNWSEERNRGFITTGQEDDTVQPKNSIRACIHETQIVTVDGSVRLRLLEPAYLSGRIIPEGTLLTAIAKIQGKRMQLEVVSMELEESIIPVKITAYDLDGQKGLNLHYSPEMNAFSEVTSNMGNSAGTNIMLTSSAGQQLAADLSKGIVQGAAGYFSKKTRMPKITVKAGHQLYLVSKK